MQRQTVRAYYGQVFLTDPDSSPIFDATDSGSLVAVVNERRSVIILTGCYGGPVWMEVDALDEPPSALNPEDISPWEVVEEVSFMVTSELLAYAPTSFDPPPTAFTPSEPGNHRARVSCRGRAEHYDHMVAEPTEEYLVQIWPEPEPRPRTHLGGDGVRNP
jgi:hypothetical protein